MTDARIRASIEAYVAAWNERDPSKRSDLLEQGCADDVILQTAGRRIQGRAALDAMISDFHDRCPGYRAVFLSAIDVQGKLFRYTGVVVDAAGEHRGDALDTGECDEDGRIAVLFTFGGAAIPAGS